MLWLLLFTFIYGVFGVGSLYEPAKPFTGVVGFGKLEHVAYVEIKIVHDETSIPLVKEKFELALQTMAPELDQTGIKIEVQERFWSEQDKCEVLVLKVEDMVMPYDIWMRDTILTRIRACLMNVHHTQVYDGVHHVELLRFQEGTYKWKTPDHPHIIFFVSDDQGYQDVGFRYTSGKMKELTPHLDAIREEGVEVEYYYTYPICSPSRTAIWTGRFTHRHGYGPSINNGNTAQISGRETLWSEVLAGMTDYYQVAFDKWHLGLNEKRNHPLARGFDAYLGPFSLEFFSRTNSAKMNNDGGGQGDYLNFYCSNTFTQEAYTIFEALPIPDGRVSWRGKPDELEVLDGIATTWNQKQHNVDILRYKQQEFMQNFIRSEEINNRPLHLYMGSRMPHEPIVAPVMTTPFGYKTGTGGRQNKYDNKRNEYLGMIYAMDLQMGELVETFKELGMWKDTVFIFMSDNTGLPNEGAVNAPLQGRKNLVWDMRVVNTFRGTASSKAALEFNAFNTVNRDLMHSVDLFPTILTGIVGIPQDQYAHAYKCDECLPHNNNILDGKNQWPSIIKPGGIEPIDSTKRLFITHVISQEQIAMQTATDPELEQMLDRHQWDNSFWQNSEYAPYVNQKRLSEYSHIRNHAVEFGTGYIQYGRYAMFFGVRGSKLSGDPSISPSQRSSLQNNPDPQSSYAFILGTRGLPTEIPGHNNVPAGAASVHQGYLHDVVDDPYKKTNLLKLGDASMSDELKDVLATMLHAYLLEQDPMNSTIDLKLKYLWMNDPAQLRRFDETREWRSYCDISIMCQHDNYVARTNGPDVPKPTKIDLSKNLFYSVTPTAEPTPPTVPTTGAPTLRPTEAAPVDSTTGTTVSVVGAVSLTIVGVVVKFFPNVLG